MSSLIGVKGLESWSASDRTALVNMASRLGVNPDFLVVAMKFESGLNPKAVNATSGASGLIQFMPSTAKNLGTTIEAIRSMSVAEQLPYVEKYFQPHAGKLNTLADVYATIFYPAAVGKAGDTVISKAGKAVYNQNKVFDKTNKGYITVDDIASPVTSIYNAAVNNPRIAVAAAVAGIGGIVLILVLGGISYAAYKTRANSLSGASREWSRALHIPG